MARGAAAASPPSWPRLPIDLMYTPASVACSCIRTRSPSSAPPVNGDDGSTASTATRLPRARNARTSALVTVDFPAPGAPVKPITRVPVPAGPSSVSTERSRASPFSTHEISRASARLSPALTRLEMLLLGSVVVFSGSGLQQQRRALAPATAERRDA